MDLSKLEQSLICSEIVSSICQSLKSRMDHYKRKTKKKSILRDLMVSDEEELNVTNSLFGFEGLTVMPLTSNVTSENPLYILKSKYLSGHGAHSLNQLTK